ncbi:hypothetical protein AAFF_G00106830 [Aldrovandia affinis]|uniref:Uncharacterized protein n=1 Tax=Aldrovandia affinis TaxID=143900 RepID=A0AAD7T2E9_9TELE|nr:hypothetical protein AAFF_G00106830 [Aldrovandia affinis]
MAYYCAHTKAMALWRVHFSDPEHAVNFATDGASLNPRLLALWAGHARRTPRRALSDASDGGLPALLAGVWNPRGVCVRDGVQLSASLSLAVFTEFCISADGDLGRSADMWCFCPPDTRDLKLSAARQSICRGLGDQCGPILLMKPGHSRSQLAHAAASESDGFPSSGDQSVFACNRRRRRSAASDRMFSHRRGSDRRAALSHGTSAVLTHHADRGLRGECGTEGSLTCVSTVPPRRGMPGGGCCQCPGSCPARGARLPNGGNRRLGAEHASNLIKAERPSAPDRDARGILEMRMCKTGDGRGQPSVPRTSELDGGLLRSGVGVNPLANPAGCTLSLGTALGAWDLSGGAVEH